MKKKVWKIARASSPFKIEKFATTGQGIGIAKSNICLSIGKHPFPLDTFFSTMTLPHSISRTLPHSIGCHINTSLLHPIDHLIKTSNDSFSKTSTPPILLQSIGLKILLWNALPGEEVTEFLLTKQKPNYLEGIALSFNNLSPYRILPKDSQFLSTSPWQILSEDAENFEKSKILTDLYTHLFTTHTTSFSRFLGFPHSTNAPISASSHYPDNSNSILSNFYIPVRKSPNNYFYRNKMEYSLYYDHNTGKIKPAVHLRGSHQKIPIISSSLELPTIWQQAVKIINELNQKQLDSRNYQSLLLRASQTDKVQGGLLENGKPHPIFPNLTDTILGHNYSYSPNGFFQINLPVYEQALQKIKDFIEDSDQVVDLYAGVGTIGLSVANTKQLTLVEVNKSAFLELQSNTQSMIDKTKNTLIKPVLAKSEDVLDLITPDTTIIVDPPRAGCDIKLIQKITEVKPQKIVYLSCNPITQVRDLTALLDHYNIEAIEGYNFFPRTPHIESLILLSKL